MLVGNVIKGALFGNGARQALTAGWARSGYRFFFPSVCALCEELMIAPDGILGGDSDLGRDSNQGSDCSAVADTPEARGGVPLCGECAESLCSRIPRPCSKCASPLGPYQLSSGCLRCRGRCYRFNRATALTGYLGVGREAALRLKRAGCEALALSLGRLLGAHVRRVWQQPFDLVAPVPMHWLRRLWRGVNATELLAESVGEMLEVAVSRDCLRRTANSRKQGVLLAEARFQNVRGVFSVHSQKLLQGKRILLVDDILTTGATASEAARELRNAGAASAHVAVVARGVGRGTVLIPNSQADDLS